MESIFGLFLILNFAFCSAYLCDKKVAGNLDELNSHSDLQELYFEQKLNHLDQKNNDTWCQRYWYRDMGNANSKDGRVALLFIHNAYTITEMKMIDENILNPLAKDLNATLFYLEHRFYGKSQPKNDTSLESLHYLSSEQALADIATFISKVGDKQGYLTEDKVIWVTIGISYGGSLATWARYKYPDLVNGAIAINAPLLAKVDFGEYFENVANSINSYNSKCGEKIESANQELQNLIKSGENSKEILKMFNLCDDITENADDVSTLFSQLAQNFANAVDFDGIVIKSKKRTTVQELCETMLRSDISPLKSYAEVNKLNLRNRLDNERGCFDYRYSKMMQTLKETDYNVTMNDKRQWIYQTCTEFGFFATSSKASPMFGNDFPAAYFAKQCQDLFGPVFNMEKIEDGVSKTNEKYGGLKINVNMTFFVYFSENPWRNLLITQNKTGFYNVTKLDVKFYNRTGMLESKIPNVPLLGSFVCAFCDTIGGYLKEIVKVTKCEWYGTHACNHHKISK